MYSKTVEEVGFDICSIDGCAHRIDLKQHKALEGETPRGIRSYVKHVGKVHSYHLKEARSLGFTDEGNEIFLHLRHKLGF
jgi:hypothetical protein